MKKIFLLSLFVQFSFLLFSQSFQLKEKKGSWAFDFEFANLSEVVYFDLRKDMISEDDVYLAPDFYKNGSASFNVQIFSLDYGYTDKNCRFGLTGGSGVCHSGGDTNDGAFAIVNVGLFFSFIADFRVELGYSLGFSAYEFYERKFDDALYFGLSLPTGLGRSIKRAVKGL